MKAICAKIFGFVTVALAVCHLNGQTNVFPSFGNVGIGTTSPITPLHVKAPALNALFEVNSGITNSQASMYNYTWGGLIVGTGAPNQNVGIAIGGTYRGDTSNAFGRLTFHNFNINDSLANTLKCSARDSCHEIS